MRRRQGTRKGDIPGGFSSDEQRSRRLTFGETRRAEVLLDLGRVAPPSQIAADMLRRRTEQQINLAASRACSLPKSKIPLGGALRNFWKGSKSEQFSWIRSVCSSFWTSQVLHPVPESGTCASRIAERKSFVVRRLQIHSGYAHSSLLVLRKNLLRNYFLPN